MDPAAHRILASVSGLRRGTMASLGLIVAASIATSVLATPALATPVLAADLPAGVLADGQVTVTVVQGEGDESGLPLAGATVTLAAAITDFPDDPPIQVLTATTFSDGIAAFDAVARRDEGGPTVHLAASASLETTVVEDGCTVTTTWQGRTIDVPAGLSVEIAVTALSTTATVCPTPTPAATPSPAPTATPTATPPPRPTRPPPLPAAPATPRPRGTLPRTDASPIPEVTTAAPIDTAMALVLAGLLGSALVALGSVPGPPRPGGPWRGRPRTGRRPP